MTNTPHPGGRARIGEFEVARIGYGAMQLGPESSVEDAVAVLRRAVELGVNHIDTASFYSNGEVNRRIRTALAPYRDDLVIVSKVGARSVTGPIPLAAAQRPAELRAAVEADLAQLGVDSIHVVNLRRLDLGPGLQAEGDQLVDLDDQLAEMIALRDEGKIGAIGISSVPIEVVERALPAGIVCVQNAYSLLDRAQEPLLDLCVAEDVAWVPYFPLGSSFPGFPKPAEDPTVRAIAAQIGATPSQVGLAWLLAHTPNTLLIAGTRSLGHLEENVGAGDVVLDADALARLNDINPLANADGVEAFLDEVR
ncbi:MULTISPECIES: aldo/keto reductase [unclassified Mycobacterium]|uniref:aldo/keto reductase n=1 Tax=unclassified Mycobacterium TaxID=2642494 RepID=UPI0029C98297|nr:MULTISPECIES: aldo/keto reductase [unclassified Mycobacterium]